MQYDAYCIKHIFVLIMWYYNMPLSLVHVRFQTLKPIVCPKYQHNKNYETTLIYKNSLLVWKYNVQKNMIMDLIKNDNKIKYEFLIIS